MKDKVKKVKVELIAKELVMSERHQVKLVKIEIFGASPASPVTRDTIRAWMSCCLEGGKAQPSFIDLRPYCCQCQTGWRGIRQKVEKHKTSKQVVFILTEVQGLLQVTVLFKRGLGITAPTSE